MEEYSSSQGYKLPYSGMASRVLFIMFINTSLNSVGLHSIAGISFMPPLNMVVDDEKDICTLLDKFLSKDGHKVRTVDNGAEAIELAKSKDFDLVLCDMVMPDVFGYDVINALNNLEKRPKIGIITGWGEKLKPIDGEDFKVDFIIKKPFDLSELSRHISNLTNIK